MGRRDATVQKPLVHLAGHPELWKGGTRDLEKGNGRAKKVVGEVSAGGHQNARTSLPRLG